MKSLLFVILSLIAIAPALSRLLALNDLLDNTCLNTPFSDFCISTLQSDPYSASAQLGVVLVDQINSEAKSTLAKINTLISQAPDPKVMDALSYCRESYFVMINASVPSSRVTLDQGYPKFVEQYMTDTAQETGRCKDKFKGMDSPLSSKNDFVHKVASDVAGIAKALELLLYNTGTCVNNRCWILQTRSSAK